MTTVQSRKAKGRRLQQYIANLLLSLSSDLTDDDVKSVPGSVNGADVMLSSKAKEIYPFSIECKNQERINLYKFWKQTTTNAEKDGLFPILVVKKNRQEVLYVMNEETFKVMLDAWKKFRTNIGRTGGNDENIKQKEL